MRLQPWALVLAALLVAAPGRLAVAAGPASIAELQSELRSAGYDPGPVNGVMTQKTQRATVAYEHARGQPIAAADPIREAQQALSALGLLAGAADGIVGPRTRDAIIRFQAANHLPVDPRVSDGLLADLEHALQPAAPAAAAPAPTPAAPQPAEPEAAGRLPLPAGVTPPPIR